jgi:uncharacterized membrane protein
MDPSSIFEAIATGFQLTGAGAMVVGVVVSVVVACLAWVRSRSAARGFAVLRETIGSVILLGLEILVAADLVRTVTSNPSLTDTVVLALIVLIRTGLSFSLQVELDGVAPWRRALITGPQRLAAAVDRSRSDLP